MTRTLIDDNTDFTHGGEGLAPPVVAGYFGESLDDLLLTAPGMAQGYGNGGLRTPQSPSGNDPGAWGSEYDKKEPTTPSYSGGSGKEAPMVVKDAPNAVEEVPSSSSSLRWWLRMVWLMTWWMPSFVLKYVGRMKRPDIRLAWREKVTIFWLIFLFNAIVIFYIVLFGRLLSPNFNKAWSINEVQQHQGDSDYWVAIQGVVYDVSDFVHGDHSNGYFGASSRTRRMYWKPWQVRI